MDTTKLTCIAHFRGHRSRKAIVVVVLIPYYVQPVVVEYKAIEQWAWRDLRQRSTGTESGRYHT